MNGVNIAWDESKPANVDAIGIGDDQIRSDKTALRNALNDEHNFPSTGGAGSGYHRFGSARPFYAAVSAVSSSGTVARLMQTSDTSEVYADTGAAMFLVGGAAALVAANANGVYQAGDKNKIAVQFGIAAAKASNAYVSLVTYNGSGFSGVPLVYVTPMGTTGAAAPWPNLGTVGSKTTFAVSFSTVGQAFSQSTTTFAWLSIGTAATGQP